MEFKNLTGLEKPLLKLLETVSEGVGVLGNHLFEFDAEKIRRIGKAEAEAEKEKIIASAKGQERALEIFSRAEKRFALEQYNKQINLENIFFKSKEHLKGKVVSEDPVEKDWTMKFLGIAQDVSREEVQEILSRVLSGEIQKPGSFSYQTLEVIKYLSKQEVETFLKFLAISTETGVMMLSDTTKDSLGKYDLNFADYLDMASLGLFNHSSTLSYDIEVKPQGVAKVNIGMDYFMLHNKTNQIKKIDFSLLVFSNAARELRPIILDRAVNKNAKEYREQFILKATEKGFEVNDI